MKEALSADQSAKLISLWQRRHQLETHEIGLMYDLVERCLQSYNPPELQLLWEGRQELIAQFIYCKVLRLSNKKRTVKDKPSASDDGHSAPSSTYALCAYFRRYLIDCLRVGSYRRRASMSEPLTDSMFEQASEIEDLETHLSEYGLTPQQIISASQAFIDGLDEPERILLCESFGREAQGGLSAVAAHHCVKSYHYRAGRLGLVHGRQSACGEYGKTLLGGWIERTLGIPIQAENMKVILSVFKILGAQASYA